MIYELSAQELLNIILNCNCIGSGTQGRLFEYDNTTLMKFYYKSFFDFYRNKSIEVLEKEIYMKLEVEQDMLKICKDYVTEKDRLFKAMTYLNEVGYCLIKGIVTYHGYPVGVFLQYYKNYSKLEDVFWNFNKMDKWIILKKIKDVLYGFFEAGIYPLDLKESNILIDVNTLDIQIIDLDGIETRYESKCYVERYPHIKENSINAYDRMIKRLS